MANRRQSEHIRSVLRLAPGDAIQLGRVNGPLGRGTIASVGDLVHVNNIVLDTPPPHQLPITLIVGMPRPQMLKRILQTVAGMGITKLCFIQTSRVEKSFWQSPAARDDTIEQQLILGLEQAMATQLPAVEKHLRFRPFVEDELDIIARDSLRYIAHPGASTAPRAHLVNQKITLAIGPEGGFIARELAYFAERGFTPLHLGARILKVETAIPVLLAKLYQTVV